MTSQVPDLRVRTVGSGEVRASADYVLYWMVAFRRTVWNFSLQRAIAWATELNKPLIILEPLRCDYRWASDRIHQFVIQGMADNARNLADKPVQYYPYSEPTPGQSRGLLAALAARACLVITDDFPCFFLPRMVAAAAEKIPVRLELVDGNGLLPMRAADRIFSRAYDFRRFLQKQRELVREGRIHNYLRMLWGKKILEWTDRPETALDVMIELNNKYALDGRNPNSYSGIFWVLGRYDRPWAPERPIFGQIRYMSSQNTARKVRLREYLAEFADRPAGASRTRSHTRPLFGRDE